ncbi:prolyl aminopeptidase [Paraglaciecola hydrolytica]|uniref:Proline iminopeptidase n=1 Tax=Paraglaciecola hydrolytica TaxID=1799789 RepID=A0A136A251_9ALTE|nr:prolyl aminopeptidase [Paraglaciecola hydrolytica]KXI29277.1 proline iminopeptidase [Paraglaciecola hydrolytica]
MSELYPAIKPFDSQMLAVGQGHTLYLEQTGNPKGLPVLFLHGGPGAGIGEEYRRFFDPQLYRIIGFDQRGCGRSMPFGQLQENTSQRLIEDVLAIKQHLQIDTWLLFGGSWGSTLALLVAISQPEAVSGLILRGIFLARQQDYAWFLDPDGGAAQLFPDYYQDFLQPIKESLTSQNIVDAYYHIFTSGDDVSKMAAIKAWYLWETRISRLHVQVDEENLVPDVHHAISLAILECHYIKYQCFIDENYILKQLDKISHIPTNIIHGRYDSVCKLEAAYSLHQGLNNSQLTIVPEAGHSAFETKTSAALCMATKAMASFLREDK